MSLFSSKIATKSMVPICRQLATSYNAGIPIVRGLGLVGDAARDPRARRVIQGIRADVENGATLGAATRAQEKYLPEFFIQLMASGELGGKLDVMLRDLADYYEDRLAMKRDMIAAAIYPMVQLAAAWFLGTFALRLIMSPEFGTSQFDLAIYVGEWLVFQAKAAVVFALVFAGCVVLARFGLLRWITGWVSNYVWPIRGVMRKFALVRFFRSFSLLISSGLNIQQCVRSAAAVTGNPYIERDLLRAVPLISDGVTLTEAFSHCRSLTPVAREMLFVGEQSGRLDESLNKVAEYHLAEANQAVQATAKILGILVLLGIATLVGVIVIKFYLTLYSRMGVM